MIFTTLIYFKMVLKDASRLSKVPYSVTYSINISNGKKLFIAKKKPSID